MRILSAALLSLGLLATPLAKADTIDFTVTITQQESQHFIPVGATYTGFVHYDGSVDPNFTGYPPVLTSYGFNFPGSPASLSGFLWEFVQRHAIGQPLFAEFAYVNPSLPDESFILTANQFEVVLPEYVTANSIQYAEEESGTVSYTYITDPVISPTSPVPEPGSLLLLSTGAIAALRLRGGKFL